MQMVLFPQGSELRHPWKNVMGADCLLVSLQELFPLFFQGVSICQTVYHI